MNIRIVAAGAAMFAGLITGTPAGAACFPLWGSLCRPAATPSTDTAAAEAKPNKPLNLRAVAHKGDKRIRFAARHRQPVAAKPVPRIAVAARPHVTPVKQASHSAVAARSRVAAARRLASLRRRPHVEARRQDGAKEATREAAKEPVKTPPAFKDQAAQVAAAVALSATATTNATASPPQTDGYVPTQNEVTELDLAADNPKVAAAEAPNPTLWNAVTPTDPAANAGVDPSADSAKVVVPNTQVASTDKPNPAEVAAPAPQQPADEPSWLRRIMIGLGGVLTLASAVRLFAG